MPRSSLRGLRTAPRRWPVKATCTAAVLVVVLLVALVPLALADTVSFPDVPASHPYHTAIIDLASRGIIGGYDNGTFGPTNDVQRQQFAKMAVLTGGYPVSEVNVCTFVDVPKGGPTTLYPDNYIAVCAAAGITTGKTPTTFDPYGNITRYQAVSMVVRMADNLHPGLLAAPPAGYAGTAGWGSDATHGANAKRAEFNGLLAGLQLDTLNPGSNMTRGECAQVLHNLLVKMGSTTTTTVAPTTTTTAGSTTTSSATTTSSTTTTTTAATATTSSTTTSSTTTSSTTTTSLPTHWESQGGPLVTGSGPAVASWASNRLDVIARGVDNQLYWKTWDGVSWGSWLTIDAPPGGVTSDPAAVSMGPNNIEVFVRGSDNACWQRSYNSGHWSSWGSLGGALHSAPAVSSRGDGKLDVFVSGPNDWIWGISLDQSVSPTWGTWHDVLDIPIAYAPAAVSWNATDVDLFYVDSSHKMWHTWFNGVKWMIPENLGGYCVSGPGAAANLTSGRIDVFVRGPLDILYQRTFSVGPGWDAGWSPLSGTIQFQGDPDAVSWGPGRIDLFANGTDSVLYHKAWVSGVWLP